MFIFCNFLERIYQNNGKLLTVEKSFQITHICPTTTFFVQGRSYMNYLTSAANETEKKNIFSLFQNAVSKM